MEIKNFKSQLWVVFYEDGSKESINVEEYDDEFLIFDENDLYCTIEVRTLREAIEEYKRENPHITKIEVFSFVSIFIFD